MIDSSVVHSMYDQGIAVAKIAKKLKCAPNTVYIHLRKKPKKQTLSARLRAIADEIDGR